MIQLVKTNLKTKAIASLICLALSNITHLAFSQSVDSTKNTHHMGGAVTVTNNGISFVPSFSLGKPAAIFDMDIGNKRLSFEPQFRFALEGKPWSFLLWGRYKLIQSERFKINIGAHHSFVFKPTLITTSTGATSEALYVQRFFAEELSINYFIAKNISIGIYGLHSNGFAESAIKSTNFITFNAHFSHIKLPGKFYMKFLPQAYYLKMDTLDGYYLTSALTLARVNFPLSIQSVMNYAIETSIPAKSDFVWNVSLVYTFRREYNKK